MRRLGGDLRRLTHLRHDQAGAAILAHVAAGGDESRAILSQPTPELNCSVRNSTMPGPAIKPGRFRAAVENHVAEIAGPVLAKSWVGKQPVDGLGTLVRGRVEDKCRDLFRGRGLADQVLRNATQEGLVICGLGRRRVLAEDASPASSLVNEASISRAITAADAFWVGSWIASPAATERGPTATSATVARTPVGQKHVRVDCTKEFPRKSESERRSPDTP